MGWKWSCGNFRESSIKTAGGAFCPSLFSLGPFLRPGLGWSVRVTSLDHAGWHCGDLEGARVPADLVGELAPLAPQAPAFITREE